MSDDSIVSAVLEEYGIRRAEPEEERSYPLRHGMKPGDLCMHREHVVDSLNRVVLCGQCGTELDPIHILHLYSLDPGWIIESRKERKRIAIEIATLKKELANLRASKKRATRGGENGGARR